MENEEWGCKEVLYIAVDRMSFWIGGCYITSHALHVCVNTAVFGMGIGIRN